MKREHRILKNEQFQLIIKKGLLKRSALCYAYRLPNDLNTLRVGVAVSKKIGNAVVRNKIKRQMRAAIRPYTKTRIGDFVFIAKKDILNHSFKDLEHAIAHIFDNNGEKNEETK